MFRFLPLLRAASSKGRDKQAHAASSPNPPLFSLGAVPVAAYLSSWTAYGLSSAGAPLPKET